MDNTVSSDDINTQFSDFKKIFNDKISEIYDEVTPIRPGIESLATSLSNIQSLDEDKQAKISELRTIAEDMSKKMVSLHENIYSMTSAMQRVGENTLFAEKEQIEPIKDDLTVLSADLGSIKDEMNKLIKSVDNISKLGGAWNEHLGWNKKIYFLVASRMQNKLKKYRLNLTPVLSDFSLLIVGIFLLIVVGTTYQLAQSENPTPFDTEKYFDTGLYSISGDDSMNLVMDIKSKILPDILESLEDNTLISPELKVIQIEIQLP